MTIASFVRMALTAVLTISCACGGASAPPLHFVVTGGTSERSPASSAVPRTVTRLPRDPTAPRSGPLPVDADDAAWGSAIAPVTLVIFADLQCGFCAMTHETLGELERYYGPERLRIVFKHVPLAIHPEAVRAARAAQSVRDLAGSTAFFRYVAAIYANQHDIDAQNLIAWAEEVGVEKRQLLARYASRAVFEELSADLELAARLGVRGTPASWVNGASIEGAEPAFVFMEVIDAELDKARALRAHGVAAEDVYRARVEANLRNAGRLQPAREP